MKAISSLLVATSTVLLSSPPELKSTSAVAGLRLSQNDNIATTGTHSQTSNELVNDIPSEIVSNVQSVSDETVPTGKELSDWLNDGVEHKEKHWNQISLHDGSVVVNKQFNNDELGSWLGFLFYELGSAEKIIDIDWKVDSADWQPIYVDDANVVQNPLSIGNHSESLRSTQNYRNTQRVALHSNVWSPLRPYTVTFRHEDAKHDIVLRSEKLHSHTKIFYDSVFREWAGLQQFDIFMKYESTADLQNWVNQNISPLDEGLRKISKNKFQISSCRVYNKSGVPKQYVTILDTRVFFTFNRDCNEEIRLYVETKVSDKFALYKSIGRIFAKDITDIEWEKSEDYNTTKSYYATLSSSSGKVISLEFKEASKEKWAKIFNYWKTIGEQA